MTRILSRRRPALVAATALALAAAGMNAARADDYDPWPGIAKDLYAGRTVTDSADAVQLEAPIRARGRRPRADHHAHSGRPGAASEVSDPGCLRTRRPSWPPSRSAPLPGQVKG